MKHGDQNSRIEILLGVIRNLLDDISDLIESSSTLRHVNKLIVPQQEADRDFEYITRRLDREGLAFLTVTLPRLGKWYDLVVSDKQTEHIIGFKPYMRPPYPFGVTCSHSIPLFAHSFWLVLHDPDGSASDKARVIRAYRSLFYLFYKLEVSFTNEQLVEALRKWKACEQELKEFELPEYYDSDASITRDIITDLLAHDESIFTEFTPKHGPGAVAGGEKNIDKWANANYIKTLHSVYPRYDLYFGFRSEGRISPAMCGEILDFVKRSKEVKAVSRLLFVPKDSRGPRTISCEPKELMFVQQGVALNLMKVLSSRSHGRINFADQTINGRLALTSSRDEQFATVDLQDASDRVMTRTVKLVFPDWTHRYLTALRSESTLLPDSTLFEGHEKYAPMGSALCFPIESMLFWALAVCAGINSGLTVTEAKATTYVYGDDIIIQPKVFPFLVRLFSKFALKVNVEKSYAVGPFRESCGVDAWKGFNVTPFKIKKDITRRSLDGPLAAAICEYSSICFSNDYRKTGNYLHQLVERTYPGIPRYYRKLACLSIVDYQSDFDFTSFRTGWSSEACRAWVYGWELKTSKTTNHLDGLSRLLRSYYGNWEEHDPLAVPVLRSGKIRKRKILVDLGI